MMDFVSQLIDWFLSENLLQFRRTKIVRRLKLTFVVVHTFSV
jgi:hypothetical protein